MPPQAPSSTLPSTGLIDIHSHLLPALDDGCADLDQTLTCIRRLAQAGFVGSICTPHLGPQLNPHLAFSHVQALCMQLQQQLAQHNLSYQLWPGAELRLDPHIIPWLQDHGVPTLAGSRCVLVDMWDPTWPRWAPAIFRWLLAHGYQPILAHPERLTADKDLLANLCRLAQEGVWLQCNTLSFTGQEGFQADQLARRLLEDKLCRFLALDVHGPDSLEVRLDGLALVEHQFGRTLINQLLQTAPRRHILQQP